MRIVFSLLRANTNCPNVTTNRNGYLLAQIIIRGKHCRRPIAVMGVADLATMEASETTEDVLEMRKELEDVCPIGNAHTFD